jgi:hypothetical protein
MVGARGKGHRGRNDQKRHGHPILKLDAKDAESLDEDMQARSLSFTVKCERCLLVSDRVGIAVSGSKIGVRSGEGAGADRVDIA